MGRGGTYICESCAERPVRVRGRVQYRLCSHRGARLQIRAPKGLATATATATNSTSTWFAALSAFPCFGYPFYAWKDGTCNACAHWPGTRPAWSKTDAPRGPWSGGRHPNVFPEQSF